MEGENAVAWELSKENIQPRKEGRDINSLMAGLESTQRNTTKLNNEWQHYELALKACNGTDKLETWYRYIVWTEHHFADSAGLEVKHLIQRCIKFYKDEENYKNDKRYLLIFLKYADLLADPTEIFNYMHSQEIGTKHAQFYKSWATVLEEKGSFAKADEVYSLGVARGAQPLDRLKRQHSEFEKRLAIVDENIDDCNDFPLGTESRASLAPLKKSSSGKVSHDRVQGRSEKSRKGVASTVLEKQVKGAKFAIFNDENNPSSNLPAVTGEWKRPPTDSKIVKENTRKPGQWNKAKISDTSAGLDKYRPTFDIHMDDELTSKPTDTLNQIVMSDRKPLSSKKIDRAEMTAVDALKPLREQDDAKQTLMYCKSEISLGCYEFSFEELRAMAWEKKHASAIGELTVCVPAEMEFTLGAATTPYIEVTEKEDFEVVAAIKSNGPVQKCLSYAKDAYEDEPVECLQQSTNESNSKVVASSSQSGSSAKLSGPLLNRTFFGNNLDSPGINLPEDIDDFMPEPVQSTCIYDINKIRQNARFEPDCNRRNAFYDADVSKIGFEEDLQKIDWVEEDKDDIAALLTNEKKTMAVSFSAVPFEFKPTQPAFECPRQAEPASVEMPPFVKVMPLSSYSTKVPLAGKQDYMPGGSENEASCNWMQMSSELIKPKPFKPRPQEAQLLNDEQKTPVGQKAKFSIFQDVDDEDQQKSNKEIASVREFSQNEKETWPTVVGKPDAVYSQMDAEDKTKQELFSKDFDAGKARPVAPFSVFVDSDDDFMAPPPLKPIDRKPAASSQLFDGITAQDCDFTLNTPAKVSKPNALKNQSPGFLLKAKSPIWAPSPTVHTKNANLEILAMFNNTLDCDREEFTLYQTQDEDHLLDFERQFANPNAQHKVKDAGFKIFDEAENITEREQKVDSFRPPMSDSIAFRSLVNTDQKTEDYSKASQNMSSFACYSNETMPGNTAARVTSTAPPAFSCSAIFNESDACKATMTQVSSYDVKGLSPIEEQSREDQSASSLASSLHSLTTSSLRNKSMSSQSCEHENEKFMPLPTINDVSQNNLAARNDESLANHSQRQINHIASGFHNLSMNSTINSSINSTMSSTPTDLKLLTRTMKMMNLEQYDNSHESSEELGERFAVKSKVKLGDYSYKIMKKIATGGFSVVYYCLQLDLFGNEINGSDTALKVMKTEGFHISWEFRISQQIHERIKANNLHPGLHEAFVLPKRVFTYRTGAVIEYPFYSRGTLLDLVNHLVQSKIAVTEEFVLIYAAEICRTVKAMHSCNLLHGDVKPDNFLLKSNTEDLHDHTNINMLVLADFGRSIDLSMFKPNVTFIGSCNTDKFECIEMTQKKPWKYQVDYFGVAGTIHVLLHGGYMEYMKLNDRYQPISSICRRWDRSFWSSVFDRLLNVSDCMNNTVLDELVSEFNQKLQRANVSHLKNALKHQSTMKH